MVATVRKLLASAPLSAEAVEDIDAARKTEVAAESEAETADAAKKSLEDDYKAAVEKLSELADKPNPIDVEETLGQKFELEKQQARVEIIKGQLPAVRATATEARSAANNAKSSRLNREAQAGRDVSQQVMPTSNGPLVDLHAAAASWALDRAMHPNKNTTRAFPACTLGEFIDNHFNGQTTDALVAMARDEISQVIRG